MSNKFSSKKSAISSSLSLVTLLLLLGAIFLTISSALQTQDTRSKAEKRIIVSPTITGIISPTPTPEVKSMMITPTIYLNSSAE